jgi:hypothetical protein
MEVGEVRVTCVVEQTSRVSVMNIERGMHA